MSEIKPSQFWIYKGTSNHCSQLEYDYETDAYEKSTPDGFYDYVCTKDTVQGGIHVLEVEPVLKLLRELGEVKRLVNSVNELLEIESKKNLSKIKPNPNNKYIPIGGDFKKNAAYYEVDHAINRFSKTLEKLNTFLASIDKGDGK